MIDFLSPEVRLYLILVALSFLAISFFNVQVGLVLMAFAMLFSPEFSIGSLGIQPVTLRAEDVLIPLLMIAWIARLGLRREFSLLVRSPLNIPILSVLGVSVLSTARGIAFSYVPSPLTAAFYIGKTAEFFSVFFLVLNYVRTERQIRRFLIFVILVAVSVGIYTLAQVPHVEIFTDRRITAPFEGSPEPATIGGYLSFFLLIIVSIFLYERNFARRCLYGLIGVIVFIPLVYTLNRTSYVAFLAGLFFIVCVVKRKKLTLFILAFLLIAPVLLPRMVKERIAYTWGEDKNNPGRDLGVDASLQQRVYAFRKLWTLSRERPILGWGVCSWAMPDSQYARTLQEVGLLGFGLWVWIFVRLFRMSKWLFDFLEEGTLKGFLLGYRAGLWGIVFHGFGAITLYIVRIMEPFWFVSGLVVSLYLIKMEEAKRAAEEPVLANSLEAVEP